MRQKGELILSNSVTNDKNENCIQRFRFCYRSQNDCFAMVVKLIIFIFRSLSLRQFLLLFLFLCFSYDYFVCASVGSWLPLQPLFSFRLHSLSNISTLGFNVVIFFLFSLSLLLFHLACKSCF